MSLESSGSNTPPSDPLRPLQELCEMSFSQLLTTILENRKRTRKELHEYLESAGYVINATSLDRYFNKQRKPGSERFVQLFAQFVGLDADQETLLKKAWELLRNGHMNP
jgi:hypothetical protein